MPTKIRSAGLPPPSGFGVSRGRDISLSINGVNIPIEGMTGSVTLTNGVGAAYQCLAVDLLGDPEDHLDIGELGRMYPDDPVIQALLGYIVRAELLYTIIRASK